MVDDALPSPPSPDVLLRATTLAARAALPASRGKVLAGLAGWTDPTLIKGGLFYPRGASKPEERLRFYATQFSVVEVDSGFYALPTATNATRWVERTPANFTFDVKAYAPMTEHPTDFARLPKDLRAALPPALLARGRATPREFPTEILREIWRRFVHAVEPIHRAGKLGCVLLQYPPWFTATRARAATIERARELLGDLPIAVEFRHASWGVGERFLRVVDLLRANAMSFVTVDEPQGLPNSMPPIVAVADPHLAVVRFHGHRAEAWNVEATVHQRFGYLYDPVEIEPWLPRVRQLAASADKVHLIFNNCMSNFAVLGAKDVIALAAERNAW